MLTPKLQRSPVPSLETLEDWGESLELWQESAIKKLNCQA